MVNSGNFFGARGRAADPMSDRQRAMRCKERGLVWDKETKKCRESRRGAGLDRARAARAANRGSGMTVAQLRAECKARGLTLDKDTKQCRERARRLAGLEAAYKRGSLFFGMTTGYSGPNSLAPAASGVLNSYNEMTPRSKIVNGGNNLVGTQAMANALSGSSLGGMNLGNAAGKTIVLNDGTYMTKRGTGYSYKNSGLSDVQRAAAAKRAGLYGQGTSRSSISTIQATSNATLAANLATNARNKAISAIMLTGYTRPEAKAILIDAAK